MVKNPQFTPNAHQREVLDFFLTLQFDHLKSPPPSPFQDLELTMEDLGFFFWMSDSIVSNHPLPPILKLLMEDRDIAETLLFTGRLPFRLIGVLV